METLLSINNVSLFWGFFFWFFFGGGRVIRTREFFTHLETIPMKAANFNLCSVLMAIEQEGSLECHTYFDMGNPFIMVISEDS